MDFNRANQHGAAGTGFPKQTAILVIQTQAFIQSVSRCWRFIRCWPTYRRLVERVRRSFRQPVSVARTVGHMLRRVRQQAVKSVNQVLKPKTRHTGSQRTMRSPRFSFRLTSRPSTPSVHFLNNQYSNITMIASSISSSSSESSSESGRLGINRPRHFYGCMLPRFILLLLLVAHDGRGS